MKINKKVIKDLLLQPLHEFPNMIYGVCKLMMPLIILALFLIRIPTTNAATTILRIAIVIGTIEVILRLAGLDSYSTKLRKLNPDKTINIRHY